MDAVSARRALQRSSENAALSLRFRGLSLRRKLAIIGVISSLTALALAGGALGFLVTWTVVVLSDVEPSRVEAEFYNLNYDPLVIPETGTQATDDAKAPSVEQLIRRAEALAGADVAPLSVLADVAAPSMAAFSTSAGVQAASFMGLRTTDARHIVYLIDASGSMIPTLDVVVDELARSLEALSDRQTFAILFFQDGKVLAAPPGDRLAPATAAARNKALTWTDKNVIPQGRSDPVAAFEQALALRPDVIFLLSENITGSGEFEIDQADLLSRLDGLNPADRTGHRPARINCVQFLSPDPLETLRRIAERHGGPGGYRFLEPAELGLVAP